MNKKVFILGLSALCGASFSALAANQPDSKTPEVKETKAVCPNECRLPAPFAGLDITEAQRTKLNELKTRVRQERKEAAKAARTEKGERNKAARQARIDAKKKYLAEVKSILGPEKYVEFLENSYISCGKAGKGRGDGEKMARNFRKHHKGDGARPGYKAQRTPAK